MKYCSNCGTPVPDDSKFCPSCGANLAPQQAPPAMPYSPAPAPETQQMDPQNIPYDYEPMPEEPRQNNRRLIIIVAAVAVVIGVIIGGIIFFNKKGKSTMTTEVKVGDSTIVQEIPLEATEGDQPISPKVAESILNQYYAKLGNQKGCINYFMGRFRGYNYPLLCVLSGTNEADFTLTLYAPDNTGQVKRLTPDVPAMHAAFYQADDSILLFSAHQGYASTSRITISYGKVKIEQLGEQDMNAVPGSDYAEPNYPEVEYYDPDDLSGIYSNMSEYLMQKV